MANPAIVKQSLTPPDFTELGARKLAELQANGYRITGYCFERQVEGTQPQRGFVDFAGFVGWWRAGMQDATPFTKAQRTRLFQNRDLASEKNMGVKLTEAEWHRIVQYVESAHGVADMKGGQDVDR